MTNTYIGIKMPYCPWIFSAQSCIRLIDSFLPQAGLSLGCQTFPISAWFSTLLKVMGCYISCFVAGWLGYLVKFVIYIFIGKEKVFSISCSCLKIVYCYTVTSHECHGISYHQKLECLFDSLFRLTTNIHQSSTSLDLCEGNPPVTCVTYTSCQIRMMNNCISQKTMGCNHLTH